MVIERSAFQVARTGNSVVPVMAEKLVETNCRYLKIGERGGKGMAEKETIKCPYCGNTEGYYEKEIVHRYLMFTFDGQPNGASEDITDFVGKRKYCQDCHRILLKKMFKEGQKTG